MSPVFRPMLAAPADYNLLPAQFPMYASPKLDGVRAMIRDGKLMTRSLKPVANRFIQEHWSRIDCNNLDGEFILGASNAQDAFRVTSAALSSFDGEPHAFFHVFDYIAPDLPFTERLARVHEAHDRVRTPFLSVVPQVLIENMDQLNAIEEAMLAQGYEGVMLRTPDSGYKYGRSTQSQAWLLKVKRFTDAEATIIEVIEKMHNANEAKINELGFMERSSHKENMQGMGVMGALRVKDTVSGVEFNIGTGFTAADCLWFWQRRVEMVGQIVKYKSQPTGVKDKPRFPVFMGIRAPFDV